MKLVSLHEKKRIYDFFCHEPYLHLYEIGDLDEFFWPYTHWYGLESEAGLEQVGLLYTGMGLPVIQAMSSEPERLKELMFRMLPLLPAGFYAHFTEGATQALEELYSAEPEGDYFKMALQHPEQLDQFDTAEIITLNPGDRKELEELYRLAYPGNWFVHRMLETGQYFGVCHGGQIVSAAGVHVYSEEFGVAALGNIATLPEYRGRGLGKRVAAALCKSLLKTTKYVGLNVSQENAPAIACYEALGFRTVGEYAEYTCQRL